jgi:hypothetical protein
VNILRQAGLGIVSIDWFANALVFAASVLIANLHPVIGFWISIVGQVLFIIYGAVEKRWSFAVFNLLYIANSIVGIIRWL